MERREMEKGGTTTGGRQAACFASGGQGALFEKTARETSGPLAKTFY